MANQGAKVDQGDAAKVPSTVLAARSARENPGDVIAVPSAM